MADASKLKGLRRSKLGVPPPPDEARTDLGLESPLTVLAANESTPATRASQPLGIPSPHANRLDGRTMRRSGRTVQFATRVSPDFDERIRRIAMRDGMLLVEVLERALDVYEASRKDVADWLLDER